MFYLSLTANDWTIPLNIDLVAWHSDLLSDLQMIFLPFLGLGVYFHRSLNRCKKHKSFLFVTFSNMSNLQMWNVVSVPLTAILDYSQMWAAYVCVLCYDIKFDMFTAFHHWRFLDINSLQNESKPMKMNSPPKTGKGVMFVSHLGYSHQWSQYFRFSAYTHHRRKFCIRHCCFSRGAL